MNLRSTYILFGGVIAVLVVFVLVLTFGSRSNSEDYLFPELHPKGKSEQAADVAKTINKVEIEHLQPSGQTLLFERTPSGWSLAKPYPGAVDSGAIDRLVNSLVNARIDKKSEAPPKNETGLDSPSAAVSLITSDKTYRVMIGFIGIGGDARAYVATGDRPDKSLAIHRSTINELLRPDAPAGPAGEAIKSIAEFRPQSLLAGGAPNPWDTVQRIDLKEKGKEIELKKDNAGGWTFQKPGNFGSADLEGVPQGPAIDNIVGVKPLLTRLAGFRIPKADDVIEGVTDFAQYGLAPGQETLRIELDGAKHEVLLVGKKLDPKSDKDFVRLEGEEYVVKMDDKPFEPIRKLLNDPKQMRDRNLTNISPFAVDAVDIKLNGDKPFELRKLGDPAQWRLFEGGDAFDNANSAAVQQLLTALTMPRTIKDFPETSAADKELGLDPPAAVIDIWTEGIIKEVKKVDQKPDEKKASEEKKPDDKKVDEEKKADQDKASAKKAADEKKMEAEKTSEDKKPAPIKRPTLKGEPTVRLALGKIDKDIVYVRRTVGVVSNLLALPSAMLATASKPMAQYLDLVLPSFDRSKVTKLTFNRGDARYEIERTGTDAAAGAWKIVKPADLGERKPAGDKIEQILTNLMSMSAESVFARKATPEELARFGLKIPLLEATVTLKDAKEPLVYQFGKESDDKQNVYFKIGGSERVYLVLKSRLAIIENGDLIDTTIWRIDASKIRGIKISGWKSLTGGMPLTLDLLRKSGTEWSVKDQADYAVDASKTEPLALALANVQAVRFTRLKGGPAPEDKLDAQADTLTLEVTIEGEKEPHTLTLGAEVKEGMTDCFAATSNKAPGAVFLVPKAPFAEIRKNGRGFFQKAK